MNYCTKCVYPEIAVNLNFNDSGICYSCLLFDEIKKITKKDWKLRENKLFKILDKQRKVKTSKYDCIIPVSGGKDSYFQTHKIISMGFKPLLVTYHGNNFYEEGEKNLYNMRKVFNCDHIVFYQNVEVLKKLNLLAFKMMGDMNWHNHTGIFVYPSKLAAKLNIPIFIYGETNWDISGMFSINDFSEYNKRSVLEHDMRGFTVKDFVGKMGLKSNDLDCYDLVSDEEFENKDLRGLFLGDYVLWDSNHHLDLIKKRYGWIESKKKFQRTYRRASNLDDMHENGVHDYLKWVKFGYGRCSDHASKDIRMGYLNREKGIKLIKKYDKTVPTADLKRWCEYTGLSKDEFFNISDTFRNPRVWKIEDKKWFKYDIDGKIRCYGQTALNANQIKNFFSKQKKLELKL